MACGYRAGTSEKGIVMTLSPELLARHTTTCLILEALERFGPLSEKQIGAMLCESWHSTGAALERLMLAGQVNVTRLPSRPVVLYEARKGKSHGD